MDRLGRGKFQGVTNIVRFNWQYYVLAFTTLAVLFSLQRFLPGSLWIVWVVVLVGTVLGILVSLFVSWYIYDCSELYSLSWLEGVSKESEANLANIHAGFDETSRLILDKYPRSQLRVFDFYDKTIHTEVSIERARKAYPPFPGTIAISTRDVPLKTDSTDCIFLILAAHEIRNNRERIAFFKSLGNSLRSDGKIVVTEHLRDVFNFLAYNFGFFHFLSPNTWRQTFTGAGLNVKSERKVTPFITVYILSRNGTSS
jgi:hypothetical protein